MKIYTRLLLSFSIAASSTYALAENTGKTQFGGRVWVKFTYDMTEDADPSTGFDVYRSHLYVNHQFDQQWSTLVTIDAKTSTAKPDAIHTPSTLPGVTFFNAFIQQKDFIEDDFVRMGYQPNIYMTTLYKFSQSRWLGQLLAQDSGFTGSQIGGLTYNKNFSNGHFAAIQAHDGRAAYGKKLEHNGAVNLIAGLNFNEFQLILNSEQSAAKKLTTTNGTTTTTTKTPTSSLINAALLAKHAEHRFVLETSQRKLKSDGSDSDAELAYGLAGNLSFSPKIGAYFRYHTGNDAYQKMQKSKGVKSFGPTFQHRDGISSALVYEVRSRTEEDDDRKTISFLTSANF